MPLSSPFTDQLSAWSTFGGALGSVLAVAVAGALLLFEMKSRNRERREAEAHQARRVTTMVRAQPVVDSRIANLMVSLTNYSDGPITEIELVGRGRSDECKRREPILRAGESVEMDWQLAESISGEVGHLLPMWFEASALFTDTNGQRWQRRNWEPPTRWPPPAPSRRQRLRWWYNRRKLAARNGRPQLATLRATGLPPCASGSRRCATG